ncbi:hypothetical protein CFO_g1748 [Ceratocystis platani]|uniref:PhoD-like phosphatase domain-containing protein n=1 Tax=Ceratocystis fimbriata f. sp. platani TaxID=88771 RepID=A0A0F8BTK2_CERFI|nr:hypothetical protein CFO_g1748 [Ceratocystis platani]
MTVLTLSLAIQNAMDLSRDETENGLYETSRTLRDGAAGITEIPGSFHARRKQVEIDGEALGKYKEVRGCRLHAERGLTFWRFNIEVELKEKSQRIAYRINRGPATGFWVPAKGQSMNIMFYSCNGFSATVRPDDYCGPDPMWRDVMNVHQSKPFHVMIGGGDQIYCDAVSQECSLLKNWLSTKNSIHKHKAPFTREMQDELEVFYLERYCTWYSQGLFALSNSQIPMVNMLDDHDIMDGYGSYPHHSMNSPVFKGLGAVAFKYYMLFQHQSITDETEESEPSWILGMKKGPYINEFSRSVLVDLGADVALLAVDGRTERTEFDVVSEDTWERIMDRCYKDVKSGEIKHLLVLLGVPIAYPRLVWLENLLTSRLMDPVKALGRTRRFASILNKIDGGVEVLDDLNDHWTAKNHKAERREIIEQLQDISMIKSVRVTILSGDVHLGGIGQFYSNPKFTIAKHKDFRYMPNVISSAIANAPPPHFLADVLNKRNKVHHFDKETDESMVPIFTHDVDGNLAEKPKRSLSVSRMFGFGKRKQKKNERDNDADSREVFSDDEYDDDYESSTTEHLSAPVPRSADAGHSHGVTEAQIQALSPVQYANAHTQTGSSVLASRKDLTSTLPLTATRGYSHLNDYDGDDRRPPSSRNRGHINETGAGNSRLRGGAASQLSEAEYRHGEVLATQGMKRSPTTFLTSKQRKQAPEPEVDLQGALDICLHMEIDPRNPNGQTVPYHLIVPRLFFSEEDERALEEHENAQEEEEQRRQNQLQYTQPQPSGNSGFADGLEDDSGDLQSRPPLAQRNARPSAFKRLLSFRRKNKAQALKEEEERQRQLQLELDEYPDGSSLRSASDDDDYEEDDTVLGLEGQRRPAYDEEPYPEESQRYTLGTSGQR